MTEPVQESPRFARGTGTRRPVWIGWSFAAVVVAVASVVIAAGLSDRGAGVRLPPAVNIGTGVTWQPSQTVPPGQGEATTDPATVEVPPDTAQVQTSTQPGSHSPAGTSSSTAHPVSGSDAQKEPADPPTTVAPDYPVVTGGSGDSQPTGGADS